MLQDHIEWRTKIEHRNIYPSNASRYVTQEDATDENGEPITVVAPVHYDALYLINGRRIDAPRMLVEVVGAEFVIMTDEDGNDLTYTQDGKTYYRCQLWYHLGEIISTENLENLARRRTSND